MSWRRWWLLALSGTTSSVRGSTLFTRLGVIGPMGVYRAFLAKSAGVATDTGWICRVSADDWSLAVARDAWTMTVIADPWGVVVSPDTWALSVTADPWVMTI